MLALQARRVRTLANLLSAGTYSRTELTAVPLRRGFAPALPARELDSLVRASLTRIDALPIVALTHS